MCTHTCTVLLVFHKSVSFSTRASEAYVPVNTDLFTVISTVVWVTLVDRCRKCICEKAVTIPCSYKMFIQRLHYLHYTMVL